MANRKLPQALTVVVRHESGLDVAERLRRAYELILRAAAKADEEACLLLDKGVSRTETAKDK